MERAEFLADLIMSFIGTEGVRNTPECPGNLLFGPCGDLDVPSQIVLDRYQHLTVHMICFGTSSNIAVSPHHMCVAKSKIIRK